MHSSMHGGKLFKMALTAAQLTALKTDILANTDPVVVQALADGANNAIANWYNQQASPDFYVWLTSLTKSRLYGEASPEATTWDWTYYAGLTAGEQGAWMEMWGDDGAGGKVLNPSLANIRAGWTDIFSGPQATPTAQRAHIAAMSKRLASYVEKLFSTGTGSQGDPAVLGFEGVISHQDVTAALNS